MAKKLSVIINGKEYVSGETKKAEQGIKNMSKTAELKSKAMVASAVAVKVAFASIAVAVGGLAILTGKALKEAADMETVSTSFNVLIGDVTKAKKTLKDLRDFAAKTPLQFNDITKAAQNLMAFGSEADKVRDQISMLGDLSMGQADKLESVVRAYGKIQAKGKASMEELNMVTEAGVPILGALADMYGVTTEEVLEMVTAGKVGFGDIDQAFKDMTSSGGKFYGMLDKQSQTFNGMVSTLKDNISLILQRFGEAVLPQATAMLDNALGALDKFIKSGALDNLATRVAIFAAQTYNIFSNLGELTKSLFEDVHSWLDRLFTLDWLRDRIQAALQPKWKDDGMWAGNGNQTKTPVYNSSLKRTLERLRKENEELEQSILDSLKPKPIDFSTPDPNPILSVVPTPTGGYSGGTETSFGLPPIMAGNFAPERSSFRYMNVTGGGAGAEMKDQLKSVFDSSGIADLFKAPLGALQGLSGAIVPLISTFSSVSAILNPLQTIFGAMMETLQPVIEKVLSPLVGILKVVGHMFGAILTPVIELLIPPIQHVAEVFVWLYNKVFLPIGNGLITVFNWVFNGIAGIYNGIAWAVNKALGWAGVHMNTIDYKSNESGHMSEIDTGSLAEAGGASGSSYTGGGTGSSTSVQSVNITIYQNFSGNVIGDGGMESVGEFMIDAIRAYAGVGGNVKVIA